MKRFDIVVDGTKVGVIFERSAESISFLMKAFVFSDGIREQLARGRRMQGAEVFKTIDVAGNAAGWLNDDQVDLIVGCRANDHEIAEMVRIGALTEGCLKINPRFLAAEWRDASFKVVAGKASKKPSRQLPADEDDQPS